MEILFFLIAVSLMVALGFLIAFFWAVDTGQYEDEYTPSVRILMEEKKQYRLSPNEDKTTIDK
ncbi:MAG: cbb3-type cytochrome oxidase assembly protein CcoS [Bacteroidota bacterium]